MDKEIQEARARFLEDLNERQSAYLNFILDAITKEGVNQLLLGDDDKEVFKEYQTAIRLISKVMNIPTIIAQHLDLLQKQADIVYNTPAGQPPECVMSEEQLRNTMDTKKAATLVIGLFSVAIDLDENDERWAI